MSPLPLENYPNVHISPFGIIPKKTMGKYRLIVDLSGQVSPTGKSKNGPGAEPRSIM